MPVVQGREYRSIALDEFEARDGYVVEGYATTFGQPYQMGEDWSGNPVYECIDAMCLDGADLGDVIFQVDHQGPVHARTRNGSLTVRADGHGIAVWADLSLSEAARQAHEAIRNGLIDRMSWGFTVGEWSYDRDTRTSTVLRVKKVYDVSAVAFPANPNTEIQARSYLDGVIGREAEECGLRVERNLAIARLTLSRLERPHVRNHGGGPVPLP